MDKNNDRLPIDSTFDWIEITAKSKKEFDKDIKRINAEYDEIIEIKATVFCKTRN